MDTYVVRVWTPAEGEEAWDEIAGLVEHVASGGRAPFHGERELLALLTGRGAEHDGERSRRSNRV